MKQRERPIVFGAEDVRVILDGRKMVARFPVKPKQLIGFRPDKCPNGLPEEFIKEKKQLFWPYSNMTENELIGSIYKEPYQSGDILYVKEPWHVYQKRVGRGESCRIAEFFGYKANIANSEDANTPWKSPVCMPKEAARIFLKVTDVRVERLQDITTEQAIKEGILPEDVIPYVPALPENPAYDMDKVISNLQKEEEKKLIAESFGILWDSRIERSELDRYGWNANPYVWVIEFEKCEKPEFNLNRKMTAQEQRDIIWKKICQKMKNLDLSNMELMTDKKEPYWYGAHIFSDDDYLQITPIHKSGREMVGYVEWSFGPIMSSGSYKSYEEFEIRLDQFLKMAEELRKE